MEVDHIVLREDVAVGQRVARFRVLGQFGQRWLELAQGTTIGHQRVLRFPGRMISRVWVVIDESRAEPALSGLELYDAPPEVTLLTHERSFVGTLGLTLDCDHSSARIHYTLDGSDPTPASALYSGRLQLDRTCTLRAHAFSGERSGLFEARADFRCWREDEFLPAIQFIRRPDPGLVRTRYAGARENLVDLAQATPANVENVSGFDVSGAGEKVAFAFRGNLEVPADGLWTFATKSDDGSRLFVDGKLLVDNDGLHGMQEQRGEVGLRAGWHALALEWFNAGGESGLEIQWSGPGVARQPIPSERLGR